MKVGAQGVLTTAESIFRGARTRVTELAARHSASDLPLRICAGERRADSLRREGPRPHATTNAARHCRRSHRIAMRFAGVHQSGVGRKEPCPCRPGASAHRCTAEISPGRWTAAFDPRGTRSEECLALRIRDERCIWHRCLGGNPCAERSSMCSGQIEKRGVCTQPRADRGQGQHLWRWRWNAAGPSTPSPVFGVSFYCRSPIMTQHLVRTHGL
jgi:hypothetical protein